MLSVITLMVAFYIYCYAECRYVKCRSAECRGADAHAVK
jgi:hypothetical protein